MTLSPQVRYLIRFLSLAYVSVLLVVPVGLILWRTFAPGFGQFFAWVSTPAAISALNLSLLVVAIVVPLNVIFGIPTALMLARNRFRGKGVLQAVIDLPFAVSPVVVGVAVSVVINASSRCFRISGQFSLSPNIRYREDAFKQTSPSRFYPEPDRESSNQSRPIIGAAPSKGNLPEGSRTIGVIALTS